MGRCTENTEQLSDIFKTDTDTDVGIWKKIPKNTEYRLNSEKSVRFGILYIHLYFTSR